MGVLASKRKSKRDKPQTTARICLRQDHLAYNHFKRRILSSYLRENHYCISNIHFQTNRARYHSSSQSTMVSLPSCTVPALNTSVTTPIAHILAATHLFSLPPISINLRAGPISVLLLNICGERAGKERAVATKATQQIKGNALEKEKLDLPTSFRSKPTQWYR